MVPGSARNWIAVHALQQFSLIKKMKTKITSSPGPLWRAKEGTIRNMRTFSVLICTLALLCVARGENEPKKQPTHATTPQHATTHAEHPAGGSTHNVQQPRAPQHVASPGHPVGVPSGGNPTSRPTGPKNHPAAAPTGNAAVKAAASAPPVPVYHYNFPTKSGLIGRDFARPLTPEEQSAIARQIANGQPAGAQAAPGGYQHDNGVYHYNFPTKSGLIGRDFARPLTPEEQSAIARQIANGQPTKTQAAPGGYQYDNGVYHYNFPTKSGLIGRDFTRPLTSEEQSAIARQIANGQPAKTQVPPGVASTQAKVNPFRAQHFNLPSKPDPTIANVKFEGTGHIHGSETWTDPKYAAFRDYHHEWHNQQSWRHHCHRIVLIAGGWYFWRASYWYPAWGYSTAYNYYPYDGPIYAYNDLAPDQVVANVQAALQALGYYDGPINGVLSPATGEALANYQRDQGLYTTSAIDEPTLAALGMA
jgi:Putative peptidoglycan binding domain